MVQLTVYKKEALAQKAAEYFVREIKRTLDEQNICRMAVSGGSTPKEAFSIIASMNTDIDWTRVQLFFVDERTVGPDDKDSNYLMVKNTLLKAPIPEENVFRMKGELSPKQAAEDYSQTVSKAFGSNDISFDLLALGMGDDGHTASLFPHTDALNVEGGIAIANEVPQLNTWRITLTKDTINRAKHLFFLIGGANKANILHEVLKGAYEPIKLPTQLIKKEYVMLLDEEAATLVK